MNKFVSHLIVHSRSSELIMRSKPSTPKKFYFKMNLEIYNRFKKQLWSAKGESNYPSTQLKHSFWYKKKKLEIFYKIYMRPPSH